jgi:arthrofactin-type cyclic lipopeptide synthetase C
LRQFCRNQQFDVINNYGPTEATVVATSGRIEAGDALHIGKPVTNATVYLLDEQQRPVPIGVMGELYVGGAGVARGYLNRADLSAERFLHDPFSSCRMRVCTVLAISHAGAPTARLTTWGVTTIR